MNADRFWELVEKQPDGGCWIWTGGKDNRGYGRLESGGRHYRAHQFSLFLLGYDLAGYVCHHLCGIHDCVNPAHLEVILPQIHRLLHRQELFSCPHGHPWTRENTRWKARLPTVFYGVGLSRECRTCQRLRNGRALTKPQPRWTREQLIADLLQAAKELGHTPAVSDFNPSQARRLGLLSRVERHRERGWAHYGTYTAAFGSWAMAIEAAGLEKRRIGQKV